MFALEPAQVLPIEMLLSGARRTSFQAEVASSQRLPPKDMQFDGTYSMWATFASFNVPVLSQLNEYVI